MDTLTTQLKKSIRYERSKTELTNLLNHKEDDLLTVIDALEYQMQEYTNEIRIKEKLIRYGEDMDTGLMQRIGESIEARRKWIESLTAWRNIFFTALESIRN